MNIQIDLLYHGRPLDSQQYKVYPTNLATKTIQIETGMLIDKLVHNSYKRIAAKIARASKRAALAPKKTDTAERKPKGTSKP